MGTYNVHGGHNAKVPGIVSYLNEVTEDRKLKNKVISLLKEQKHTVYDCTDDAGNSVNGNLANIVTKCNAHSVDLDISIHINGYKKDTGDGKNKGVEVCVYSNSSKAKAAAQRVCKKLAALGFTNRGVKVRSGLYVLKHTKSPAMLIEVCFADDKDDVNLYNKLGVDKISKAIVEGILNKTISTGTASSSSTEKKTTYSTSSKAEVAKYFSKSLAGTYIVNTKTDPLMLRTGAGSGKTIIAKMPKGAKVQCYGYYNLSGKTKWLYVEYNGKTGYASSTLLKKK